MDMYLFLTIHLVMLSAIYAIPSKLRHVKQNCSINNKCACTPILTALIVHHKRKLVSLEYNEYGCEKKMNMHRKLLGLIGPKYECRQLRREHVIYHDIEGNPVHVKVKQMSGCCMKCVAKKYR